MKPRSLRRTFQDQSRFLFNQERSDHWCMAILRADLEGGTAFALEIPDLENDAGEGHCRVIHPRTSTRVRHIHILGDSIPLFAEGTCAYRGQPVALLMGQTKEDLQRLKSLVKIHAQLPDPEDEPGIQETMADDNPGIWKTMDPADPLYHLQSSMTETSKADAAPGKPGQVPGTGDEWVELDDLDGLESGPVSSPESTGDQAFQAHGFPGIEADAGPHWEDWKSPLPGLHQTRTVLHGSPDQAFGPDSRILESHMDFSDPGTRALEPRGAMAEWKDDLLTIHCATSWPHLVRRAASEATGLAQRHIRVISQPAHTLPDRFLLDSTFLAVWAALGAMTIMGKAQLFIPATEDGHWGTRAGTVSILIQSAHDPDGRLLGLRTVSRFDMGAFPCASSDIMQMAILGMCSVYRCPSQEHRVQIQSSMNPPRFPPSLMGMNFSIQAMEQHVEQICRVFHHESLNWRVQNILRKGESCPYGTVTEQFLPAKLVLQSVSLKSDYPRSHAAMELIRSRHQYRHGTRSSLEALRGTGMALSFQSHGLLLSRELENRARLGLELSDDGHLTIRAPMHAGNQGIREAWIAAVEESLGIEERNISFVRFSSQELEDVGPARFSRVASVFSPLLAMACASLKKRIRNKRSPFSVMNSWVRQKNMVWDEAAFQGTPFLGRSWASAVVELSLNPVELHPEVRMVCISIHAGAILHPDRAESQIRQGIMSCLAWLGGDKENVIDGEAFHAQQSGGSPQIIVVFENQDDPLTMNQKLSHAGALGELVYGCLPAAYNNALCQITRSLPESTPLTVKERSSIFMPRKEAKNP